MAQNRKRRASNFLALTLKFGDASLMLLQNLFSRYFSRNFCYTVFEAFILQLFNSHQPIRIMEPIYGEKFLNSHLGGLILKVRSGKKIMTYERKKEKFQNKERKIANCNNRRKSIIGTYFVLRQLIKFVCPSKTLI